MAHWYSRPRYDGASDRGGARHSGRRPAGRRTGQRRRRGLRRAGRRRASPAGPDVRRRGTGPPTGWPVCWPATGWARARWSACSCRVRSTTWSATPRPSASVPSPPGINLRLGAPEVTSILERTRPVVTSSTTDSMPPTGPAGTGAGPAPTAWPAPPVRPPDAWPDLAPVGPGRRGVDQRDDGATQGRGVRPRQPAGRGRGTDVLSEAGDRRLSPLPFAHVGSMTRVWDEAANGVTTVITPTPWKAADAVAVMAAERITVAQGVPTQWALVLARPELADADLTSLADRRNRRVPGPRRAGGGHAARPSVSPWSCATRRPRPRSVPVRCPATPTRRWPPRWVDRCPGWSFGWRTTTACRSRPARSAGSGCARRRSCAATGAGRRPDRGRPGWSSNRQATDAVLADDGWLTTGDFGYLDDDGRLHLVGRANELYIRGGYNVYPAEVEGALGDHPVIDQVAVVGAARPGAGRDGRGLRRARGRHVDPDPGELLAGLRDTARRRWPTTRRRTGWWSSTVSP